MDKARLVPKGSVAIFAMLTSCFALWGLLNNMTDNLVPAFQKIFMTSQSTAGYVQVSFYGAYSVIALLASFLIQRAGYRFGVLVGLGVYVVGALLYIPACVAQSFWLYIVGIFIVAGGCAVLETTCNPYVLALGDESTAVRRLNFAQMFNPVGSFAGIVLAQQLILSHLNPATAEQRLAMPQDQLAGIVRSELFWVCVPYVGLCTIAALIWLFFFRSRPTDVDRPEKDPTGIREVLGILMHSPRWYCGVVAQVFYVGVQIAAWTWMNVYCQKELGVTPAQGASYYLIALCLFIACRWNCTFLMKWFEPARMMAVFALGAILSGFGVMYLGSDVLFTACGLPFSANVVLMSAFARFMFMKRSNIHSFDTVSPMEPARSSSRIRRKESASGDALPPANAASGHSPTFAAERGAIRTAGMANGVRVPSSVQRSSNATPSKASSRSFTAHTSIVEGSPHFGAALIARGA